MTDEKPNDAKAASNESELTFEQAIEHLEQLIDKIESGEVGLEAALKHYEQGTELIKHCRGILNTAERRIAELTTTSEGRLQASDQESQSSGGESADDGGDGSDQDDDVPF